MEQQAQDPISPEQQAHLQSLQAQQNPSPNPRPNPGPNPGPMNQGIGPEQIRQMTPDQIRELSPDQITEEGKKEAAFLSSQTLDVPETLDDEAERYASLVNVSDTGPKKVRK